jgi:hypothetical protein
LAPTGVMTFGACTKMKGSTIVLFGLRK